MFRMIRLAGPQMVEMHPNVACSTMTVPPQLFQGLQCHAHQNGPGDVGDGEGG